MSNIMTDKLTFTSWLAMDGLLLYSVEAVQFHGSQKKICSTLASIFRPPPVFFFCLQDKIQDRLGNTHYVLHI